LVRRQSCPSPLVEEGWDGGEKLGIAAVLMLTPTPPSPVEGEGTEPRLIAPLVPTVLVLPQMGEKQWRSSFAHGVRAPRQQDGLLEGCSEAVLTAAGPHLLEL
jgi:hypothetical protein